MKAIVIREHGGPEVLRYEDVPIPEPGPGEVLIKVHSVSVNRSSDLQMRQDGGGYGVPLPMILGVDPAGVVDAVGDGLKEPRVGDRVALHRKNAISGGYAEYAKGPAHSACSIPDGLSFAEATVVTRHFPTAYSLANIVALKAGEWVLIMGAAGALGSCAVQVAKERGAQVIAGAGADERVAAACELGADYGVNYNTQDLAKEVKRITGGRGVDVVFDNIADPTLWPGAFNSLADDGRLATVGAHGGGLVPLDVKQLYLRRLRIMGGLGANKPEDYEHALTMAAQGRFRVRIQRTLPLREAAEGHRLAAASDTLGKIILDPTLP